MGRLAWAVGGAAMLWVMAAGAGERFYSIIGPDGKIQQVRGAADDDAESAPESKAAAGSATVKGATATGSEAVKGATAAVPASGKGAAEAEAGKSAALPHAPYDSEQYVDSELVDGAVGPAAGQQRFYMIDDGTGARVTEMGAGEDAAVEAPVDSAPVIEEPYEALAAAFTELDPAAAVRDFPELPACAVAVDLKQAPVLAPGAPVALVVDRAAYLFLDPTRVLATYRVEGNAPRTVVVRSYSRKDRRPAFVHPRLAFLGEDGCLKRVLHGYFERRYQGTDRRHAMLRGDLIVHADEAWLLVLAPRKDEKAAGESPFLESGYGQLKFTLKK